MASGRATVLLSLEETTAHLLPVQHASVLSTHAISQDAAVSALHMESVGQELTVGDVRGAVDKDSDAVGLRPVAVILKDPGVYHEAPLTPCKLNLQN